MRTQAYYPHFSFQRLFFDQQGYLVIPGLFSSSFVQALSQQIRQRLHTFAHDLACSYQDYLTVASRWAEPSPVTKGLRDLIYHPLQDYLDPLIGESDLIKLNIISKTPFSPARLPFHQDIAYSPTDPYQLSAWLALTDANLESGPLEFIPRSHQGQIETAVDFWAPDYQDPKTSYKRGIVKVAVRAGDLVCFDSRLWHGSGCNQSSLERFALVTRWRSKTYVAPLIPDFKPQPFGMWTCQKDTENILRHALNLFFREKALNYLDLLKQWEKLVSCLSFLKNYKKAQQALKGVRLLHLAYKHHNGGDAQGIIYKQLWHSFLKPLSFHLDNQPKAFL